jgi:predicted PurR-regulated permease PerM
MQHEIKNKPYFYIFISIVLFLGLMLLWPVKDMILLAWVMLTLFRPIYNSLIKLKMHKYVASTVSLFAIIFTILVPLSLLVNITLSQFQVFYRDINNFMQGGSNTYEITVNAFDSVNKTLEKIPFFEYRLSVENVKVIIQQNITPVANYLLNSSLDIGVALAESFPLVIIFLYLVWYGFPEYDRIIHFIKRLSPLSEKLDNLYVERITAMIVGLAKGTITIAVIQGSVAGISLALVGVPYAFFWAMVMIFVSIIPLGTAFVIVPVSVIMLGLGNVWAASFLMIVQLLVTSNLDNVLRPMLVPKEAEVHPVMLLLSILGGIQLFGMWGVIYGPLIMVMLLTTLEVYQKHYKMDD